MQLVSEEMLRMLRMHAVVRKNSVLLQPYTFRIIDHSLIKPNLIFISSILFVLHEMQTKYSFSFIFFQNKFFKIVSGKISGESKNIFYGMFELKKVVKLKVVNKNGTLSFTPPKDGKDWMLVINNDF
jgi:hypothetical protein